MANWTILKTAIADVVRANGNQEITGPLLQGVLNSIVNAVGEHATFAGIAIPSTNPGVPDGPVFYLASKEGIYPNFGLTINFGESAVFKWQEDSWVKLTTGFATTALVDKHLPNSDLMSLADTRENTLISSSGALSETTQDAKVFVIDVSDYWTKEVYISTTKTTGSSLFYAFYNSADLSSSSYMPEGVALAGNSFSSVVSIPPGAVKLAVANIDNTFVDFKVVLLGVGGAPHDKVIPRISVLIEKLGSEQQTVLLDNTSSFINMVWVSSDGKFVSSGGYKSFIIPLAKGVTYKFPDGANFYTFSTERPAVNGTGGSTTSMSRTSSGEFTPDSDGFGTLAFSSSSFTSYTYYVYASGVFKNFENYVRCPLKGKKIVMFGDSIIEGVNVVSGQKRMNVLLASISQATCVNGGIGGSQLGARNDVTSTPSTSTEAYANIDIPNLVYAWANKSWSSVDAAVAYLKSNAADDNTAIINNLKGIDIADTDIVVIAGGTNDLNAGSFGTHESADQKVVRGGIKYIVENLLKVKPTLSIYFFAPLPRIASTLQEPDVPVYSDDYRAGTAGSFLNLVKAIKEETELHHIPCGDTYYKLGINQHNIKSYGGGSDGTDYTHLTKCYPRYARFMYEFIVSNATWGG